MIYRSATTLLALVAATAALLGQTPDPKSEFTSAVGQFSLALEGAFGDEGTRVRSSLDAMSRTLNAWDSVLRQYESALAADLRTADPALATRLHMALAGLYFDRTRTADGLREISAARQLDQNRADLPMFEALAHSQLAGNATAAAAALRRSSTLNPNDSVTAYLLARSLSRTGSTDEATQASQRFATAEMTRSAQYAQAVAAPFIALGLFHETPGVEPFFPPALYADGFAELQRGNYMRAIDEFRKAAAADPLTASSGVESGALSRAAAAFRSGSLDAAAEALAVAIELAPESAEPRRVLGLVHVANRHPDAAVDALTQAIRLNPRDERSRLALADALVEIDRLPEARQALQDTLALLPRSGRARHRLGLVYQRQGLYPDAVRELTAAVAARPMLGLNSVYQSLGALGRAQQQYDAAIDAFSHRVDLVPNDANAHHELGEMYFRQSRHGEALAEFLVAVMLSPTRTDSLAALGQVHLRNGGWADAAAAARRAIALDAAHKESRYVLATALIRLGSVEEGTRELEVYQRLQTEATAAQSKRLEIEGLRRDASLAITNGDGSKAIALLRQVLERDPDPAASHLDLGIALIRAGQPAEAVQHLTAAAAKENGEDAHAYLAEAYSALGRQADAARERATVLEMRQDALRRASGQR